MKNFLIWCRICIFVLLFAYLLYKCSIVLYIYIRSEATFPELSFEMFVYRRRYANNRYPRQTPYGPRYGYSRPVSNLRYIPRWRQQPRVPPQLELKNLDISSLNQPALGATSGTVTIINSCSQGTTAVTRVGRMTRVTSIEMRLSYIPAANVVGFTERRRVMIVRDKRSNGSTITGADVLETDSLASPLDMANIGRFQVLYDKTKWAGTLQSLPDQSGAMEFYFKKNCNYITNYGLGNAGTAADISVGGIWVIIWSNGQAATALPAADQSFTRVTFADA